MNQYQRLLLFCVYILISGYAHSQSKTVVLYAYFETDRSELNEKDRNQIKQSLSEHLKDTLIGVTLRGHTDSEGDSLYNIELSRKRTKTVRTFLVEQGVDGKRIRTWSYGEDKPKASNTGDKGKQINRRVDIYIKYNLYKEKKAQIPTQIDTCQQDTTLYFDNGSFMTFDICEFKKIEGCIEVVFTNTVDAVLEQNQSLQDSRGALLSSCGMLSVNIKPECLDTPCFNTPPIVTVPARIPDPQNPDDYRCDPCRKRADFYVSTDGGWVRNTNYEVKRIDIDGKPYYQFKVPCANQFINCDCKIKGRKVEFKLRGPYIIHDLYVTGLCPDFISRPEDEDFGDKRVLNEVICQAHGHMIGMTLVHRNGDTLVLHRRDLDYLQKRIFQNVCETDPEEEEYDRWLFWKVPKQNVYGKYIIRRKHIKRWHNYSIEF